MNASGREGTGLKSFGGVFLRYFSYPDRSSNDSLCRDLSPLLWLRNKFGRTGLPRNGDCVFKSLCLAYGALKVYKLRARCPVWAAAAEPDDTMQGVSLCASARGQSSASCAGDRDKLSHQELGS